ncbi:uncharacterized protein AB675_9329 [Cyphellophora attinorum]|uniref:Glyoxalase/fosfomycin resistance/dioxygenase domain-containing protein n=1 Tax=Cyphellophora attinorum TaxID=1664694 RepID=A0A0N1HSL1_9EURO|nr:uncharacterized protein AB675_9329 [Phialophora attinorum]KPI41643.1 hypothetical protein AB675_9329 [Phialophora attinorum]
MRKRKDNYAFFARGNIFLAAIGVPAEETLEEKAAYRRPTKGLEIVFEVDDLEAERDRIVAHGYKLDADIAKQEWGLTDFRVVDPDGYFDKEAKKQRTPGATGAEPAVAAVILIGLIGRK